MSRSESIASNLAWKFGERITAQLVSTIVSIILARLLMPEDYGLVAIVSILITLFNALVTGGFGNALIQKENASPSDFSSVFYISLVGAIFLYTALFVAAEPIAMLYESEQLCPIIRVMGLRIPLAAVNSIQHAYISKNMQFKKFFLSTIVGTVASGIVGISMAIRGYGPWALVGQYLTNVTIDTIVLFVTGGWRPKLVLDIPAVKQMMPFSLKLMATHLSDAVFNELRSIIIFSKYSSADLSMYENGKKYPNLIVTNINTAVSSVMFPAMSKEQSNTKTLRNIMKRAVKLSTFLLAPMLLGFAAIAPRFVSVVLTEKWMASVPYLQITCCMCMFYPIHTINIQAMNAIGQSGKTLKLEIIKKIINVIILAACMSFGVLAIVLGALGVSWLSTAINAFYSKKYFSYSFGEQMKDILPSLVTSIIMAVCVMLFDHFVTLNGWIMLGLDVLLGAVVFLILCVIFRIGELRDLIGIIYPLKRESEEIR